MILVGARRRAVPGQRHRWSLVGRAPAGHRPARSSAWRSMRPARRSASASIRAGCVPPTMPGGRGGRSARTCPTRTCARWRCIRTTRRRSMPAPSRRRCIAPRRRAAFRRTARRAHAPQAQGLGIPDPPQARPRAHAGLSSGRSADLLRRHRGQLARRPPTAAGPSARRRTAGTTSTARWCWTIRRARCWSRPAWTPTPTNTPVPGPFPQHRRRYALRAVEHRTGRLQMLQTPSVPNPAGRSACLATARGIPPYWASMTRMVLGAAFGTFAYLVTPSRLRRRSGARWCCLPATTAAPAGSGWKRKGCRRRCSTWCGRSTSRPIRAGRSFTWAPLAAGDVSLGEPGGQSWRKALSGLPIITQLHALAA